MARRSKECDGGGGGVEMDCVGTFASKKKDPRRTCEEFHFRFLKTFLPLIYVSKPNGKSIFRARHLTSCFLQSNSLSFFLFY